MIPHDVGTPGLRTEYGMRLTWMHHLIPALSRKSLPSAFFRSITVPSETASILVGFDVDVGKLGKFFAQ